MTASRACGSVARCAEATCASTTTPAPAACPIGEVYDATVLSDEHAQEIHGGQIRAMGFTGAFVGLWVWDLSGHGHHADYDQATFHAEN